MGWQDRISVDPAVLGGKPVVKGTRIAVEFVIELLKDGWTTGQITKEYPHITGEDIRACRVYAREVLGDRSLEKRTVVFLPWLKLASEVAVGDLSFVPWMRNGSVDSRLDGASSSLQKLLIGYVDAKGAPIGSATIVISNQNKPLWNFGEQTLEGVWRKVLLLFLAAFARNKYEWAEPQVNSSHFETNAASLSGEGALSVHARRREGMKLIMPIHQIQMPLQCDGNEAVKVDLEFLNAMVAASNTSSRTMKRLMLALPFFSMANTCDNAVLEFLEIIQMAAAFEQLLGAHRQNKLADALGDLLDEHLTHEVRDIQESRGVINADVTPEERVHRAWIKEMYKTRNKIIHDDYKSHSWAWSMREHLVIAAVVFPLAVKLSLAREGHYTLNADDEQACRDIEKHLYPSGRARFLAEVGRKLRSIE